MLGLKLIHVSEQVHGYSFYIKTFLDKDDINGGHIYGSVNNTRRFEKNITRCNHVHAQSDFIKFRRPFGMASSAQK